MAEQLLKVEGLTAGAAGKEILHGIDLEIGRGETHVLMGPNGAGKSTLAGALMGDPELEITGGTAVFDGEDLLPLAVDARAKKGMFLSFQNPIEVPGISLENFLRTAIEQRTGKRTRVWAFRKEVKALLEHLQMDPGFAERDLNVGFSGGEKKKAEMLQMLLLKPSLAILDETDSGLDVDAVRTVSKGVEEFQKDRSASLLIITHNAAILSALHVDAVHILVDGKIVETGGPELIGRIGREGFAGFEERAEDAG
ncbi:MAG: Fe-S cluster assembly ATPase SufC [Lachnospiraceae bacterium]|nr:Fe-S cluster assembly ATPase SufC [Lachnospiraceae bacterium]